MNKNCIRAILMFVLNFFKCLCTYIHAASNQFVYPINNYEGGIREHAMIWWCQSSKAIWTQCASSNLWMFHVMGFDFYASVTMYAGCPLVSVGKASLDFCVHYTHCILLECECHLLSIAEIVHVAQVPSIGQKQIQWLCKGHMLALIDWEEGNILLIDIRLVCVVVSNAHGHHS